MEILENITPANVQDRPVERLSYEDFRKLLCSWFEDSGLISETRSYLRMQLIRMLSATKVGIYTTHSVEQISPQTQIINILIAEHLLRCRFFYTLSMLSNEMSIFSILPEFNFLFVEEHTNDRDLQFKRNQIMKIISYLNVPLDQDEMNLLFSDYYNVEEQRSLLVCLLTYFANYLRNKQDFEYKDNKSTQLVNYFKTVLTEIKCPQSLITLIEHNTKEQHANQEIIVSSNIRKALENFHVVNVNQKDKDDKVEDKPQQPGKAKNKMKLISLHDEKRKMIRKIYKYRIQQVTKVQKQLEEKLKQIDFESPQEVQQEICRLKHCDETCQNVTEMLVYLQGENVRLVNELKMKSLEVERLKTKLSDIVANVRNTQRKVTADNRLKSMDSVEYDDELTDTDQENKHATIKGEFVDDEKLKGVFSDVYSKLEILEIENEAINSDYNIFKKLNLSPLINH